MEDEGEVGESSGEEEMEAVAIPAVSRQLSYAKEETTQDRISTLPSKASVRSPIASTSKATMEVEDSAPAPKTAPTTGRSMHKRPRRDSLSPILARPAPSAPPKPTNLDTYSEQNGESRGGEMGPPSAGGSNSASNYGGEESGQGNEDRRGSYGHGPPLEGYNDPDIHTNIVRPEVTSSNAVYPPRAAPPPQHHQQQPYHQHPQQQRQGPLEPSMFNCEPIGDFTEEVGEWLWNICKNLDSNVVEVSSWNFLACGVFENSLLRALFYLD